MADIPAWKLLKSWSDILIVLDYYFEKLNNTGCKYENEAFDTLDGATDDCKDDQKCQGVFSMNCDEQEKYHKCFKNATMTTYHTVMSCFYRKTVIGKLFPTF